jgi:hypothetical protein
LPPFCFTLLQTSSGITSINGVDGSDRAAALVVVVVVVVAAVVVVTTAAADPRPIFPFSLINFRQFRVC